MDYRKQLIFLKGTDKTESIQTISKVGNKYDVRFHSQPTKKFLYGMDSVLIYYVQEEIDPTQTVIINGGVATNIKEMYDFGEWYRIIYKKESDQKASHQLYAKEDVEICANNVNTASARKIFNYIKSVASGMKIGNHKLLEEQYQQQLPFTAIEPHSVLGSYLAKEHQLQTNTQEETVVYPFGINQSQKKAVENALTSQVSIIQGPPGTGKTQTILNIIANIIMNDQTVAIVSNNNAATKNVLDKLIKYDVGFVAAYLGNNTNKEQFIQHQPPYSSAKEQWQLENPKETRTQLEQLTKELTDKLALKNRLAVLKQELADITLEYRYFQQNQHMSENEKLAELLQEYSATQVMTVYSLCKEHAVEGKKWRFWDKVKGYFNYGRKFVTIMSLDFGEVADDLLNDFYQKSIAEYTKEQQSITEQLETYAFDSKLQELADLSMAVFKDKLCSKYPKTTRRMFSKNMLRENPVEFVKEYPVVLSSTCSIKTTLKPGFKYDYVIVDEASQVNLATGVLAMSCGHKLVIVGDDKQLPMVIGKETTALSNQYWDEEIGEAYHYTTQSLLSSACLVWQQAPIVLLKEHYRCHPQIINFCNKKFYHNELVIMTSEKAGDTPLVFKKVPKGNHERDNANQREIDIIKEDILPQIKDLSTANIGVITPYNNQVDKLKKEIPSQCEVATVHAFQGREKDTIIISTVSNNTSKEFVNDPKLINVAVSRAVKQLIVVTSSNKGNDKNHYGDLMKYIDYQTMGEGVTESKVQSIFDYLYKQYFKERQTLLAKHKKISKYDSENLMHLVITDVLNELFPGYDCAYGVMLKHVVKDSQGLSEREVAYLNNPLTHIDFLIFNRMNKEPVLAIEVDGVHFHQAGSQQAERDQLKNHILQMSGLPLIRMRTDGSQERDRLINAMQKIVAL